jgi:hypothetical protein
VVSQVTRARSGLYAAHCLNCLAKRRVNGAACGWCCSMRERIGGNPGSQEWRDNFGRVLDAFLLRLSDLAQLNNITRFVACDEAGEQIPWVWSETEFRNSGRVGTLRDARDFARNMIDQGMYFACAVAQDNSQMWLTAYERPEVAPAWPRNVELSDELRWDGVASETMPD